MTTLKSGQVKVGPMGEATELLAPFKSPAQVALWFVNSPQQGHPLWNRYIISIVHLRPLESLRVAYKEFDGAGYELLVLALDPSKDPQNVKMDTWIYLQPQNVFEQFTAPNDEEVVLLCEGLVDRVVKGRLLLETSGFMGAKAMWTDAIQELKRGETNES